MSPPKTTGKTGETGKPSIDAGFRASGLQKQNREKPGIRGAGENGQGAEMAALALPESDPPPTKKRGRGRPKGSTSVALTAASVKQTREYIELLIAGKKPTQAQRIVAGKWRVTEGTVRRQMYRHGHRVPEIYEQEFRDEVSKLADVDEAIAAMKEVREWIAEQRDRWIKELPSELVRLETHDAIHAKLTAVMREGLLELSRRALQRADELAKAPRSTCEPYSSHGGVEYLQGFAEGVKPIK